MAPTHRAAEQEHFGGATPGEAQAEEPRLERDMVDDGDDDGLTPTEVVVGLFATVFNAGELDAVDEFVAPDHQNHDPTAPLVPPGPQGVRMLAEQYREAFPDLNIEIEELFGAGDRVAHRWTMTGTHEGEILGIAPTGRRIEVSGIEINRVAHGKVADSWALSDSAGLREQLEG
jgi:steroid delta-isomerase-like uncharacterized protein